MEEGPGREEGREGPSPKGRLTWEITGRATPQGKGKERLRCWEGRHTLQTTPGGDGERRGSSRQEKTTKSKLSIPRGRGSTVGVPSGKHTMSAFSKGQAVAVDKAPPNV